PTRRSSDLVGAGSVHPVALAASGSRRRTADRRSRRVHPHREAWSPDVPSVRCVSRYLDQKDDDVNHKRFAALAAAALGGALALAGCGGQNTQDTGDGSGSGGSGPRGEVRVDGSSTVQPL